MRYSIQWIIVFFLLASAYSKSRMQFSAYALNETPFYKAQMISAPTMRFPRCHSSQVYALLDGSLIAAWWNGSEEAGKDLVIRGARRLPGKDRWESPVILADTPNSTEGNPVFFMPSRDELWLFYRTGFPWAKILWMRSTDEGETWTQPEPFINEPGWTLRNRIIRLQNGTIVIPALTRDSPKLQLSRAQTVFIYSEDHGKTWKRTNLVRTNPGNNEPALFQRSDGSLLAYMRPYDRDPTDRFLWQCESFDSGRTWTEAKRTNIKNPSSAIELLKLQSGHVVLAFNDSHETRSPLCLALSLDDGRTWKYKRTLENGPGRFSYPALAQSPDDRIHVTYTFRRTHIKHAELNEKWIMERPWIDSLD